MLNRLEVPLRGPHNRTVECIIRAAQLVKVYIQLVFHFIPFLLLKDKPFSKSINYEINVQRQRLSIPIYSNLLVFIAIFPIS